MMNQAISAVKSMTTAQLCGAFDATETQTHTPQLSVVRGWIMDELEARNKEAFDKWIENDGSPSEYFAN